MKNKLTLLVLVAEIIAIVVLHTARSYSKPEVIKVFHTAFVSVFLSRKIAVVLHDLLDLDLFI